MTTDQYWMQQAIALAREAQACGEVPVGAIVVLAGKIIGRGYNQPISACDPTAHAEVVALRGAARHLGNYRLPNTTVYVTLEPCTMCLGALVHSRIQRLVFGAREPKSGVVESQAQLLSAPYLNHRIEVSGGVCAQSCGDLLNAFFARRRKQLTGPVAHK